MIAEMARCANLFRDLLHIGVLGEVDLMARRGAGVFEVVLARNLRVRDRGDPERAGGEFDLQIGAEQRTVRVGRALGLSQEGVAAPLGIKRGIFIAAEIRAGLGVGALVVRVRVGALPGVHARRMLMRIARKADVQRDIGLIVRLPGDDVAQRPVMVGAPVGRVAMQRLDVAVALRLHARQAHL